MPVRSADVACRTTNRSKLVVAWRHEKFSQRPEERKTVMYGLYVTMWIIVLTCRKSSINGDVIRNIFQNWRFFNGSTMDYLTLRWFLVRAKNPGHGEPRSYALSFPTT